MSAGYSREPKTTSSKGLHRCPCAPSFTRHLRRRRLLSPLRSPQEAPSFWRLPSRQAHPDIHCLSRALRSRLGRSCARPAALSFASAPGSSSIRSSRNNRLRWVPIACFPSAAQKKDIDFFEGIRGPGLQRKIGPLDGIASPPAGSGVLPPGASWANCDLVSVGCHSRWTPDVIAGRPATSPLVLCRCRRRRDETGSAPVPRHVQAAFVRSGVGKLPFRCSGAPASHRRITGLHALRRIRRTANAIQRRAGRPRQETSCP